MSRAVPGEPGDLLQRLAVLRHPRERCVTERVAGDTTHRVTEVAELVRALQRQVDAIAHDQALRGVLRDEQSWLERAQRTIEVVRAFREGELRRFWPAMWRRWAVALAFALASAVAFGSGYVWTSRPYEAERVTLRSQVELFDVVAQRVLKMTSAERRQFDALMKWNAPPSR